MLCFNLLLNNAMKQILSLVLMLLPTIVFAYRDRPAVGGDSFTPIRNLLMVLGMFLLVVIGRVVVEFLKMIDWGKLFKGLFYFMGIGGLVWFFVLVIFGRSCSEESSSSKNQYNKTSSKIQQERIICKQCSGRGTWEIVKTNPNLYDSNGNIRTNQPFGVREKVICSKCNGTGYEM